MVEIKHLELFSQIWIYFLFNGKRLIRKLRRRKGRKHLRADECSQGITSVHLSRSLPINNAELRPLRDVLKREMLNHTYITLVWHWTNERSLWGACWQTKIQNDYLLLLLVLLQALLYSWDDVIKDHVSVVLRDLWEGQTDRITGIWLSERKMSNSGKRPIC